MNDDKALLDWIYGYFNFLYVSTEDIFQCSFLDLENFGLTLVFNVPHDPKAIQAISKRVAFPKPTHYGVDFVVRY